MHKIQSLILIYAFSCLAFAFGHYLAYTKAAAVYAERPLGRLLHPSLTLRLKARAIEFIRAG